MAEGRSSRTMVRTRVTVDEVEFFLAQGQDVAGLKQRIEGAIDAGGRFVDFTVVGNRQVSVMISAHSRVVVSVDTAQFDVRDTGDNAEPYGGEFDLL